MFGKTALQLIKMMGHSGVVPSAIMAEDVPAALDRLKNATQSECKVLPSEKYSDVKTKNRMNKVGALKSGFSFN